MSDTGDATGDGSDDAEDDAIADASDDAEDASDDAPTDDAEDAGDANSDDLSGDVSMDGADDGNGGETGDASECVDDLPVLRLVHLIADVPEIALFLGASADPLADNIPLGANTDADGADYTPLPTGDYTFRAVGLAYEGEFSHDVSLAVCEHYTVLFLGSVGLGAEVPIFSPSGATVVDDLTLAEAGTHRLTVFHAAPGAFPGDLWVNENEEADFAGLDYNEQTTLEVPAGEVSLGWDLDLGSGADGLVDVTWALTLPDGGWSYFYVLPDPVDTGCVGTGLHHVRAIENLPVVPSTAGTCAAE